MERFYLKDLIQEYGLGNYRTNLLRKRLEDTFEMKKDGNYANADVYIESSKERIHSAMMRIILENKIREENDPIKKYEMKVSLFSDIEKVKFKFLIATFNKFVYTSYDKSNDKKKHLIPSSYYLVLEFLVNNLDMDVNKMDNNDWLVVIEENLNPHILKILQRYLNFLKINYKDEINFEVNLGVKREYRNKNENDFYSFGEWDYYYSYFTDIDEHIYKAFENHLYSKYWLFYILHLSLAWRKDDIWSFAPLNSLLIDKYDLEWFYQNDFTFEDALYIVTSTKLELEQYFTQKTGAKLHFNIPIKLMIPTAIAIIINEQWRRKEELPINEYRYDYRDKLFGDKLNGFTTLKANRTLLSLVNKKDDKPKTGVPTASYMRSHKMDCYHCSDSTLVYLKSTYDERELNNVSYTLFDKGAFGWLFDYVLSTLDIPVDDMKNYDIGFLEETSNYLLSENSKKSKVINELMSYSQEELVNVIDGCYSGKQQDVYCIKSDCNRVFNDKCLECEYSIPTIFTMMSIKDEIEELIVKINNLDEKYQNDKTRYLYRLLKLLNIVKEFGNAYGMAALNIFLDYNQVIEDTKKIMKGD